VEATWRFAVLGSGNGGRAFCAQAAAAGYPVRLFEPLEETEDIKTLKKDPTMGLEGDLNCSGKVEKVTLDIAEAMEGANVLLVVVPSFAHQPIFEKMIPHLADGQHVIIFPGNYGGLRLKRMMANAGCKAKVTISETASLPYACRIKDAHTVHVYKLKKLMKVAASPSEKGSETVAILKALFADKMDFKTANNLLEVSLDNINFTLHPLPVLLNFGEIEKRPATFRHYMDGITPLISDLQEKMDEERIALGRALGLTLVSTMQQLKEYYGNNDTRTIYEYVNSPETPYADLVGQKVTSRYLTEDVPGLLVPALDLARKAGVSMPVVEAAVKIASVVHGTDYAAKGLTLETLDLDGFTAREIVEHGC
jgi:opine dehydrogenase